MIDANNYLFEYIKNMIYYPTKAELDIDDLPNEYRKLATAIKSMCEWSQEANEFAGRIAEGDLDTTDVPLVDNGFAANVKALQSVLLHMTWQTKQIAKGDYSQKMLYMGELSEAFNEMASQLQTRTEELNAEKDLLRYFIETSNESVIVLGMESNDKLYSNGSAVDTMGKLYDKNKIYEMNALSGVSESNSQSEWKLNVKDENGNHMTFRVYSVLTTWLGGKAVAHMAEDITSQEDEMSELADMAMRDPLTGMYNRRYAVIRLAEMMKTDLEFAIAFVDIDYLKYCNDEFGHVAGDQYIVEVATLLKKLVGEDIVVRSGGDEFILICVDTTAEKLKDSLKDLREKLMSEYVGTSDYIKKSFSYGVVERYLGNSDDVSLYLEEADRLMYEFKRKNKQKNNDYNDDRIVEEN